MLKHQPTVSEEDENTILAIYSSIAFQRVFI